MYCKGGEKQKKLNSTFIVGRMKKTFFFLTEEKIHITKVKYLNNDITNKTSN